MKLEAKKADIAAKYAKVKKAAGAEPAEIDKAVADAKETAGVAAANDAKTEDMKANPNQIHRNAGRKIVSESGAKQDYATEYTVGATDKTVEEYINAGVTWGDWHVGYEEPPPDVGA